MVRQKAAGNMDGWRSNAYLREKPLPQSQTNGRMSASIEIKVGSEERERHGRQAVSGNVGRGDGTRGSKIKMWQAESTMSDLHR